MKVLIAGEVTGVFRDAFLEKGHGAWSCDLKPTQNPGPHYTKDWWDVIPFGWDLIIAHPVCTYLCNSGVRWLYEEPGRMEKAKKAAKEFWELWELAKKHAPRVCFENPIPHKYGVGKTYTQLIQPWQFGHTESKATCLWLHNLPKLGETNNVKAEMMKLPKKERSRVHYASPGDNRGAERAESYPGIGKAMAEQWGGLINN